jgi:hypothetical protein
MGNERLLGRGLTVIVAEPREGLVRYMKTPKDVLALLKEGNDAVTGTILMARAGTVTFLGPLLPRHPVGIITIEGAPQSHLGILSREFGLPAVMSINLEGSPMERLGGDGVPNEEYIDYVAKTLDGQRVILDCSDAREGRVYQAEG